MKRYVWVKWYQYGENGLIDFGQMPLENVADELRKFEKQALETLKETGADHVVYGLKVYGEDGYTDCVKFYMKPMSNDDFYNDVATLKNCIVYAVHKR